MAKFAGDLAYIEGQQCNDPGRPALVRTAIARSRYWPTAHGSTDPLLIDAGPQEAGTYPSAVNTVPATAPDKAHWLPRVLGALLAVLTFGVQVAGVVFVIVLIAKYSIR